MKNILFFQLLFIVVALLSEVQIYCNKSIAGRKMMMTTMAMTTKMMVTMAMMAMMTMIIKSVIII